MTQDSVVGDAPRRILHPSVYGQGEVLQVSAANASKMVVLGQVAVVADGALITGDGAQQAFPNERMQIAVNSSETDAGHPSAREAEDRVDRRVLVRRADHVQNHIPLA